MKVWAGDPSYETVKDRVNTAWTAAGRPASELACKSTVAYCFRPGRRRMDTDLVLAVVQALHPDTGYVNQWRQALRVVTGETEAVAQVRVQDSLPQDLAGFTGRTGELDRLRHAARGGKAVVLSAIEGMAGVGKTQLAVHAGHLLHGEEPFERVLFVNLRGFDPALPPADPAAVLDGFLRLLGMPAQQIPHTLGARATAYRDRLAGTRALVVLDNAATTDQVRPLLPATPGCLTLVTSRRRLSSLRPATHFPVDVFAPADARAFLIQAVSGVPVGTDPDAAARIARRCGHLPLALSLITGHIRNTPGWTLTDHADRLDERHQQRRLDSGVELALRLSYQLLPADRRRLLRLLALHPGQDFDAYAAAALTGSDLTAAQEGLDHLQRDHLLQRATPGRYTFHDLVRAYATTRATDEDPPPARRAALTRLFDYYLATAWTAMDIYYPAERPHRLAPPAVATPLPAFGTSSAALTWLHDERPSLLAVAQHAAVHDSPVHAVGLSTVLYRYLDSSAIGSEQLALHSGARQAAVAAGDRHGEAFALLGLGTALMQVNRHEAGVAHLTESAGLFRQQNDPIGEGRALNTLGVANRTWGRLAAAVPYHQDALRLFRLAGEPSGEGHALASLGAAVRQLGRSAEAAGYNTEALAVYRRAGDRCGQARALNNLGLAEIDVGRLEPALDHLEQACAAFAAEGDQRGEASALDSLGGAYHRVGDHGRATDCYARSVELFRGIGCSDSAWPLAGLGELALEEGRPAAALATFTEVLSVADETGARLVEARAHSGVGRAHHALGNRPLAREHCTRARRLFHELEIHDTPGLAKVEAVLADLERTYWDTVGATKTFTHPIDFTWLSALDASARLVDYGCGYGRITALASDHGFTDVEGVDTSPALIERARRDHPGLAFQVLTDPPLLPWPDASVDAVLLVAVLTCVPADAGQRRLVAELARVLRPGGLLYVSDLLLQSDPRNLARYRQYADVFGTYGVFETGDGAVCRHHSREWLEELLLASFAVTNTREVEVNTMNGNSAKALQLLAVRRAGGSAG